jgi:hypothetical protein
MFVLISNNPSVGVLAHKLRQCGVVTIPLPDYVILPTLFTASYYIRGGVILGVFGNYKSC